MASRSYAQVKAIEKKNRERLLKLNPNLNDNSGIYFWTRTDENGIRHAYVGQAKHILSRNIQHLMNFQRVDLSIKAHGLFDENKNPYGYKLNFLCFPIDQLNEKERFYITMYAKEGYQMKNIDTGGGKGKQELGDRKPTKGYRDGIKQGCINSSRKVAHLFDKHLVVSTKDTPPNRYQEQALVKFNDFLELYKGEVTEDD